MITEYKTTKHNSEDANLNITGTTITIFSTVAPNQVIRKPMSLSRRARSIPIIFTMVWHCENDHFALALNQPLRERTFSGDSFRELLTLLRFVEPVLLVSFSLWFDSMEITFLPLHVNSPSERELFPTNLSTASPHFSSVPSSSPGKPQYPLAW